MKTAVVISTLLATAYAGCFGGGEAFQDKATSRWHVQRACEGYDGQQGVFQGWFGPGAAKTVCVQVTGTQKIDMLVQNLNTGAGFDLGDADCTYRLQNEINGCDHGGQSDVSGWRFKVDPNSGIC
ncbi:hypothetical protein F5Y17DRAFT_461726 [Xylariaceae sp. FL0594]|nr:hypothetical protein F5Y17DRAFT_461726 [Xylariaceae sp. FL0594]